MFLSKYRIGNLSRRDQLHEMSWLVGWSVGHVVN
jgi:hypothetical protein